MNASEILVPVEWTRRSLAALTPARSLAENTGSPVHLVSVIPKEASDDERRQALVEEARRHGLQQPRISVLKADLNTMPVGSEESGLMRLVDESPEALVCMATHARSAVGDLLLGSVAGAILNRAKRPVMLTGPRFSADWRGPVRMLVVCLDGSPLSEAIIDPAADMASATGVDLLLVQVQSPDAPETALSQDAAESGYLQARAADIRRRHGLQASWDVLHGKDPGRAIADYVAGFPDALVAMTTHGYTGLRRLAFGSVARDVVHGVGCPVLVYRPEEADA